ncbi:activating transcription factor 7-interacting protein 1 isoform B [Alligator mississippiensis]|uniref:Activating transcription factor 7-interacting protein 1 isoform B n=1 Tax=Alligator mississippiensis TaxID=8496 RepID=A0A151LZ00_ALLMI|nr:activating transcription factor 7-interacting protein 1 isoform B [Alligator mississippiensis]
MCRPFFRVKMDSTEEPQKKVFKARKTMRVSDRQQLEAVYKVKEELLKTTEVKLLNGKHENGDSDLNSPLSNTDCMEDKKEVNGLVDACLDSEEKRTDSEETTDVKGTDIRAENKDGDLEPTSQKLSSEDVTSEREQGNSGNSSVSQAGNRVLDSNKDDHFQEEDNIKKSLDQREGNSPAKGECKLSFEVNDSFEEKVETNELAVSSDLPVEELKSAQEDAVDDDVGEGAISSSVETEQEPRDEGNLSINLSETTNEKTLEEPSESILENTDSMETDEIIPILEKLAPAEDGLSCFPKASLLPVEETSPELEEKIENSLSSPSKQESNESLPKEAFLVLSDEEEPCEKEEEAEVILLNKSSLPGEVSRRKRSKSEDMDSIHSKRRRYMEEDYEAELQVKITARGDINQKVQKVIQRLLEEKLTALQVTEFEKALTDLKTRVEKIECSKRHKTVLIELQAKIAKLAKRCGTAEENLKKKQENTPNPPPLSPGKAASDTGSTNSLTYRNAGTVRQMLESKRNVGDSTPATFQAPLNAVSAPSFAAPQAVVSGHPKPQTPVTSSSLTTSVLPTASAATVVGTSQATRTPLPTVGTSGLYNPTSNRGPIQMKISLSAFGNAAPAEPSTIPTAPRVENQINRPPTDASGNKRAPESTAQSGKVAGSDSGGVIDLTLDDEDDGSSQDAKKQNPSGVSGTGLSTQPVARPLQPLQTAPLQQTGVPTSGPSQTTIHVLPTAPTTVNVTHRPVTQTAARLPVPRAPANHQVVYTTLPAPPAPNPVRGAVMQSPGLRQVNPQSGGVTVRVPQTTAYVVNNGLTLGSGAPQLTVHHRPPQVHAEPPRPVHPAPLPEAPQPARLPPEAASTSLPQKPQLKLARVQSQNGIVLSWSVIEVDRSCASVDSYHLYAYHEDPSATMPSQWKKIGEVKALPLPMACTLTQFVSGSKYYFAVRAKDIYGRFGPFCDPQSTDVISSQTS